VVGEPLTPFVEIAVALLLLVVPVSSADALELLDALLDLELSGKRRGCRYGYIVKKSPDLNEELLRANRIYSQQCSNAIFNKI